MGHLTLALDVTLDGCCDHREMVANDEMHLYWTRVMDAAGAMPMTFYRLPQARGTGECLHVRLHEKA